VKNSKDGVDASNEDRLEGVLANNGTPFYIMAILVVIMGGLGFAVHSSKKGEPSVLKLTEMAHIVLFMLNSAGMFSEMVLGVVVISSGVPQLLPFALMLFASRLLIGVVPGLTVFMSIFSGKYVDLVDATTGKKALKYYINVDVIVANSKLYVVMLALAIFEPTLLAFLPWYDTEMSQIARFPTIAVMKQVYFFEVLQLLVTLAAQLGIIFHTQGDGGTFGIVAIMNVVFSGLMLCLKGFDMFLKWGVLRGASKNTDCDAAQKAWKQMQSARKRVSALEFSNMFGGGNAEEGESSSRDTSSRDTSSRDTIPAADIFVSNPMLNNITGTGTGDGGTASSEEHEGLLARFQSWEQRIEAVVEEVQSIEHRTDTLEARTESLESWQLSEGGRSVVPAPPPPDGDSDSEFTTAPVPAHIPPPVRRKGAWLL
jgi:hypothetical protein